MRIEGIRTLQGPNIFHHKPVLIMTLDLEERTEVSSDSVDGFVDRLLALLPGLGSHTCSRGYEGGFVERLREGTYPAHITEHVCLELSHLAGIGVNYGKSVHAGGRDGVYKVVVRYSAEEGMRFLLRRSVEIVEAMMDGRPLELAPILAEAREIIEDTDLGPSTRSIVVAAEKRKIPWRRVGEGNLIQFGWGRRRRFIQAAVTEQTSAIGVDIAQDKELTKAMLRRAMVPVPRGAVVRDVEGALEAFRDIGGTLCIKPLDANQGKGVTLNVTTEEEVRKAFAQAQEFRSRVIVEEMFRGNDYRVLVVGGRMVAAAQRVPAHVVGDGKHTVAQLVERVNQDPRRGSGHGNVLTKIRLDEAALRCLTRANMTTESVPAFGQEVFLKETGNLSTGGTARDVTDEVHPEIAALCERAARIVGLDICGVDLVMPSIAAPPVRGGGVIELNAGPGLRMHVAPSEGKPRDVGEAIIEMLFDGEPARIPLISITGTNGKTTTTRMIAHCIQRSGKCVGMTTSDGISIGGRMIESGDTTGPRSAEAVLSDPAVEVAVLETARGGIMRAGLAYDWSDVGVITNIQPDHFGQDGIESLDDILHVKSLVAERVREGGTIVLNADDDKLARLMDEPRLKRIPRAAVYFSLHAEHLHLRRHVTAGGRAYVLRDGWLVELDSRGDQRIVEASAIPVTMGGAAEFQIANALAAAAACRAYGLSITDVATGLKSFGAGSNSGRMNLYRVGRGHLLLDYGHNPEAITAVARTVARLRPSRATCVIGLPGDREDSVLRQSAAVVANAFDRVIVREDVDLRGRAPGELATLICRTVKETNAEIPCTAIADEREALKHALGSMVDGELVVLFYDELAVVRPLLESMGAERADFPAPVLDKVAASS